MGPRRAVQGAIGIVAAATAVGGVLAVPAVAPAAPTLNWGSCAPIHQASPDTQCATLTVPRDYSKPNGPTISITVSRIPARNQDGKRGVLIGNPGGPGVDGISMFTLLRPPTQVRDEWDLVSVQPRGLIDSTPVRCDEPSASDDVFTSLGKVNRDRCEKNTPGYTRTLTTENTARDIERVRQALGVQKVSLYGVSYGTWLMSTYATLFPQHTDRVVLDSAVDPARVWGSVLDDQTSAYESRARQMMAWIAANDDVYHLGETPLAVYRRWSDQVSREAGVPPSLMAPPARVGDVPPGLQAVAQQYIAGVNLTADARARLENLVATLTNPGSSQATSSLLGLTRGVAPDRNGWPIVAQRMTGQLKAEKPSKATLQVMRNFQDMQAVIICNEDWAPHDSTLAPAALIQNYLIGDIFTAPGLLFKSGLGCAGTTPVTRRIPVTNSGLAVRPLLINSLGDPQTPYRHAQALRQTMRAHLITVGGGDHGQLGRGNTPLDAAIADYLRTGATAVTRVPQGPITTPLTASR
ncbi:alpha/beta fold hydrolase [Gordonia hydrophobica]|uniref:Alpha/beta fold hydrolase n=1 Tax=Gordonia hydrophobica TaxID=40516 RepID=A0ABZ2U4A6_9ACTN|nr:alpha/beta fold hydrolase [Gordonia hydrophobica]MBM7368349.1 pimeloyl-ACP methyl ester carboxylesterase [Gordonia hydrophobica]